MKEKIFISHSSKNQEDVKLFVDNILSLGLNIPSEKIFCTSMNGHGINGGEYIPDRLKEEIHYTKIALLMISNEYKKSEVCLNEIGAAWATLEKENVIPIIFPDVNFDEIGFLNLNKLSLKLKVKADLLKLCDNISNILNIKPNLERLDQQIELFLTEISSVNTTESEESEWEKHYAFGENTFYAQYLDSFSKILSKSDPTSGYGLHEITIKTKQNNLLSGLNHMTFNHMLYYLFSEGDFHINETKQLSTKNWLINNCWEMKLSTIWIHKAPEPHNEFILIKTEALPPYEIGSDIGGNSFRVGVLNNGCIISENEYNNGYAEIEGITKECSDANLRYRDKESLWIFIATSYHKIGYGINSDEIISFCKFLDQEGLADNKEKVLSLTRKMQTPPLVLQNR